MRLPTFAAAGLIWVCASLWAAVADLPAEPTQLLRQALFQRLDPGAPAAAWQAVELPDTWAARGLPTAGSGRYRLHFPLAAAPQGVWAVRIDRLSAVHSLRINGVLVQQRGDGLGQAATLRPGPMPVLAEFPAQLLRQGDNQIDIEWRLGFRAGMSDLQVGSGAALRQAFERDHRVDYTVPELMNAAGAALAAFMLLIWWQRRRERAIGLFGLLWLLVSLRNYAYYVHDNPVSGALASVLFFVVQAESAVLLGAFAVALSAQPWPRFRRLLWGGAAAIPPLALLGSLTGQLDWLRQIVYPASALLSLAALAVLWQTVRKVRRWALLALLLGLSGVVVAGAHDYLFQQGLVPVTHFFWLPYAVPLGCMWFALVLVQRMVQALKSSEDLAARLESRVAERTQALDQANQAQSRFMAAASHDLRQPVAAIGLLLGLAREREQAPAQRHLLDRAQQAAQALEDLLRGLLDLSRLDPGGAAAPRHQPVALQALFDAIATHELPAAQARGQRLRFVPTRRVVQSDPLLLEQVLRNLVGNALRYTQRGGVLVAARRGAGGVRLQVWDTGQGIALADQQRVFEPFVQLANPERDRRKGQGLGLAIVRRSVDLLGHPLGLRSVPERGSCFTILLPRAPAPVARPDAALPGPAPLAGLRLWLLDDDPAVRAALVARLEAWGAQVQAHASLAALAQTLDCGPAEPHGLLTDQRLPDGDGLQAIARLRARLGPVPALMFTGDTATELLARAQAQGVPVLHKPVATDLLLQALGRFRPAG